MNETPAPTSLVLTNDQQPALDTSKPKPSTAAPKWETAARERMKGAIKKFAKPLGGPPIGISWWHKRSFASKVRSCTWIYVGTTCGSGWVDDEHAILLGILNSDG